MDGWLFRKSDQRPVVAYLTFPECEIKIPWQPDGELCLEEYKRSSVSPDFLQQNLSEMQGGLI